MTRLSGGEVEALCLKAARGAGLAWGLAEEAGHAVRRLHEAGLDGATALARYLEAEPTRGKGAHPRAVDDLRARDGGPVCPIALGALLSDLAALPRTQLGPVAEPGLLLPFLRPAAMGGGEAVRIRWTESVASVGPEGGFGGDAASVLALRTADLTLSFGPAFPLPDKTPTTPAPEVIATLDALAMRTTVPASRASASDAGGTGAED